MNELVAIDADIKGDFAGAIVLYSALHDERALSADGFSNLVFLCWQVTDYGFLVRHSIDDRYVESCGRKLHTLICEHDNPFPDDVTVEFWIKYTKWIAYGDEELTLASCRAMRHRDPLALDLALGLFCFSNGLEEEANARELRRQCALRGTHRDEYTVAVLNTAIASHEWAEKKRSRSR